jgi:hypothetical protein
MEDVSSGFLLLCCDCTSTMPALLLAATTIQGSNPTGC